MVQKEMYDLDQERRLEWAYKGMMVQEEMYDLDQETRLVL